MSTYYARQTARIPRAGEAGPSSWRTQRVGEMGGRPAREVQHSRQADLRFCTQSEEDDDEDDLALVPEELTGTPSSPNQKKSR